MRIPNPRKTGILLGIAMFLLLPGSGCRLAYLFHAAVGQARLLSAAVPVDEGLQAPTLSPEEKKRLRLVSRIKAFGEETLGLRETENYRTVYLKSHQPPIYVVSACPKDRLAPVTWWFPIVGRMPYLGFFDRESAREEESKLAAKNLDVTLGMADAYSTLGWFQDPVTLNLIQGSTLDLVETILHEMTHATLYIKGQGAFNEGLAVLVGKVGALMFLRDHYGPEHPFTLEAGYSMEDERIFATYMDSVFRRLEDLYEGPLSSREKIEKRQGIFRGAIEDFDRLRPRFKTDRFTGFGKAPLNNAYLLGIGLYHRHFPLFERMLRENDYSISRMIQYCRVLSKNEGDMIDTVKHALTTSPSSNSSFPSLSPSDQSYHLKIRPPLD